MSPKQKATHAAVFFVASIRSGGFGGLFDMMRYDNAVPATEAEASKMERAANGDSAELVIFRRFYPIGGRPDVEMRRWESFGVEVSETFREIYDADDARKAWAARLAQYDKVAQEPV